MQIGIGLVRIQKERKREDHDHRSIGSRLNKKIGQFGPGKKYRRIGSLNNIYRWTAGH